MSRSLLQIVSLLAVATAAPANHRRQNPALAPTLGPLVSSVPVSEPTSTPVAGAPAVLPTPVGEPFASVPSISSQINGQASVPVGQSVASAPAASSPVNNQIPGVAPVATTTPIAAGSATVPEPSTASQTNSSGPAGGVSSGGDTYQFFQGDGSAGAGWPDQSAWLDFETMFTNNKELLSSSCTQFGVENNSDEETQAIHDSVLDVAKSTGVDERFILAVIMQESKGCVRVHSTVAPDGSVVNPGLMQSHNGRGNCNTDEGVVSNPCPNDQISQMIKDGTSEAPETNLKLGLDESGATGSQSFYIAARVYNSGSVDGSGDLGAGVATHCYASDIANRLTGFVSAASTCTLDAAA